MKTGSKVFVSYSLSGIEQRAPTQYILITLPCLIHICELTSHLSRWGIIITYLN